MPRTLLALLVGALAMTGDAAWAGDITVTVHVRHHHRPHLHHNHHPRNWAPPSGPQIYYSQHPDHVPAHPHHLRGVAVPVFPNAWMPRIPNSVPAVPHAHLTWCASRYVTYRLWDNTFQPHYGPRRQCRSPYR